MLKKICKYLVILIAVLIIIIGLIFISPVFFPFKTLKLIVDSFAFDKSFDFFTIGFYLIAKYIGIVIIFIGILFCLFFKKICLFLYNFFKNLIIFFKDFFKKLYSFFKYEDKFHLIVFFLILLITVVIRLIYISQPMRYDEAYTYINFVKSPLWMTLADLRNTNNHIFHSILVKISCKIFGDSLWAIRLPAFIFGILIAPISYVVSRIFYNKNIALVAMALISASSYLIEFSTNARGYTIVIFIFLITLGLAKYIKNHDNIFACILFAFISSLGFFTMSLMFYPFSVIIIWLLSSILTNDSLLSKRTNFKNLIISVLLTIVFTLIFYSRAIFKFGLSTAISSNFSISKSWLFYVKDQLNFIKSLWFSWNRDIPTTMQILLIICFIIALVFHKKLEKQKINIFISVIIIFLISILTQKNAIIFSRHWIFLLPLYMMVSGAGLFLIIETIQNKINLKKLFIFPILSLILSIGLCSSVFFSQSILKSDETGTFKEAENIVTYLSKNLKENDIALSPDYITQPILIYYFDKYKISGLHFTFKEIKTGLNSFNDIFIIVKKDQLLTDIIDFNSLRAYKYNNPELLKLYGSYYLYKIQKID